MSPSRSVHPLTLFPFKTFSSLHPAKNITYVSYNRATHPSPLSSCPKRCYLISEENITPSIKLEEQKALPALLQQSYPFLYLIMVGQIITFIFVSISLLSYPSWSRRRRGTVVSTPCCCALAGFGPGLRRRSVRLTQLSILSWEIWESKLYI